LLVGAVTTGLVTVMSVTGDKAETHEVSGAAAPPKRDQAPA